MNAPVRHSDFIGQLCIALAHRWEPERLFMPLVLTGYLDESGTHDGSPITVMGGIIATARQWADFERKFAKVKKKYGFNIFHTKKFKKRAGDFSGWSRERCLELNWELAALTSKAFIEGVSMTLDNDAFQKIYKQGEKPRKLNLESKYGLCFRESLLFFLRQGLKRMHREKYPRLHIVLESGHPNVGGAITIFNQIKKELKELNCDMLETITVADKDECDPLMMADFIAHSSYSMELKEIAGMPRRPMREPGPKESGVTHLKHGPDSLAELKQSLLGKLKNKLA